MSSLNVRAAGANRVVQNLSVNTGGVWRTIKAAWIHDAEFGGNSGTRSVAFSPAAMLRA